MTNVAGLPKCELHLHLDCSLSYNVVVKIDPTITYEAYLDDFIAPQKCTDLADFLTRAVKGFALMQTKEQLQWVVHDLFQQLAADNMLYAEIRFAPLQHTLQGLTPEEVVAYTEEATALATRPRGHLAVGPRRADPRDGTVHRLHRRLHGALPHARPRGRRPDGAVRRGQGFGRPAAARVRLPAQGRTRRTRAPRLIGRPGAGTASRSVARAHRPGAVRDSTCGLPPSTGPSWPVPPVASR